MFAILLIPFTCMSPVCVASCCPRLRDPQFGLFSWHGCSHGASRSILPCIPFTSEFLVFLHSKEVPLSIPLCDSFLVMFRVHIPTDTSFPPPQTPSTRCKCTRCRSSPLHCSSWDTCCCRGGWCRNDETKPRSMECWSERGGKRRGQDWSWWVTHMGPIACIPINLPLPHSTSSCPLSWPDVLQKRQQEEEVPLWCLGNMHNNTMRPGG